MGKKKIILLLLLIIIIIIVITILIILLLLTDNKFSNELKESLSEEFLTKIIEGILELLKNIIKRL